MIAAAGVVAVLVVIGVVALIAFSGGGSDPGETTESARGQPADDDGGGRAAPVETVRPVESGETAAEATATAEPDPTPTPPPPTPTPTPEPLTEQEVVALAIGAVQPIEAMGCGGARRAHSVLLSNGMRVTDLATASLPLVVSGGASANARSVGGGLAQIGSGSPDAGLDPATTETEVQDRVSVLSLRGPSQFAVVEGVVRAVGSDALDITVPDASGVLGAPVMTEDGQLAGVVTEVRGVDEIRARLAPEAGGAEAELSVEQLCEDIELTVAPEAFASLTEPTTSSMLLAQRLASALADHNWSLVRALEPRRAGFSDAQFYEGWGMLRRSTLVPVRGSDLGGGLWDWRVGLVAHEVDPDQVTKVFCVTWRMDIETGRIEQTGRDSELIITVGGWLDPMPLSSEIQSAC